MVFIFSCGTAAAHRPTLFKENDYMDALITAFVSGKGGTGKSTTAVYVGAALASLGKSVVLVELAPSLRSVDIIAQVAEQAVFDIEDVLSGRAAPGKAVIQSPLNENLFVIPAPYTGGRIVPESMQLFCTRLRPHFDFILLDVAAGFGPAFQAAASVAHRINLVEMPDPVSLRDGRALVNMLDGHPAPLRLILSRVDAKQVIADGALADLDEAIDIVGVQLLGVIPQSEAIRQAGMGIKPLPPNSRENKVYLAIARRMLGEEVPLIVK